MITKSKIHQEPTVVNPEKVKPVSFPQKHPKAYTYKSGLRTEFTLTKRILELKDNKGKALYMQAKFILACLMTSAIKTGKYPTVLTSVRRMTEHFGMTRRQIVQAMSNLQNTQVQGVNLIDYRPYNTEEALVRLNDVDKKASLCPGLDIDKKQTQILQKNLRRMLHSRHSERFIEIQISAYEHIKYDSKREKDFFFDAHTTLYKESLDVTQRVLLFFIQSRIEQNKSKGMQEKSIVSVGTIANYFNFYPFYVQKILKSLHDKRYISYIQDGDKTLITLTEKGSRKIQRFEDGSVEKYSRENRKKMEEEKAKEKAEKKTTKVPKPPQDVLQEMKATEYPSGIQTQQPPQTQQEQKKEAPKREVSEEQDIRNGQEEMLRQYHERNALNSGKEQEYFTTQEWAQFVDSKKPKPENHHRRILRPSRVNDAE